jgi:hypothetical protein
VGSRQREGYDCRKRRLPLPFHSRAKIREAPRTPVKPICRSERHIAALTQSVTGVLTFIMHARARAVLEDLAAALLGNRSVESFRTIDFALRGHDTDEMVALIASYHRLPSYARAYEFEAAPLFVGAGIRIKRRNRAAASATTAPAD